MQQWIYKRILHFMQLANVSIDTMSSQPNSYTDEGKTDLSSLATISHSTS